MSRYKRFSWHTINEVTENGSMKHVFLEGSEQIELGSGGRISQQDFLVNFLRSKLVK